MPDNNVSNIEEIIECLESTIHNAEWANKTYTNCDVGFLKVMLALLKEKEPVSVQRKRMEMVGLKTWDWACGNCGQTVLFSAKFCPWCGRAVKWE